MRYEPESPNTPEKQIKLKGHGIMMRLNAVGVPWDKCNLAALVVALELKQQFQKLFQGSEAEKTLRMQQFDKLEEGIKGFMPMPKEEVLKCFIRDVEQIAETAVTVQEFKEAVLEIIRNPKTKFKLFI